MKPSRLTCAAIAASILASCLIPDAARVGGVWIADPRLVPIAPGVAVVADASEPVFHADGRLWLYRSPYWYESDRARGGFTRVEYPDVPDWLLAIERPERYARYVHTHPRATVTATIAPALR